MRCVLIAISSLSHHYPIAVSSLSRRYLIAIPCHAQARLRKRTRSAIPWRTCHNTTWSWGAPLPHPHPQCATTHQQWGAQWGRLHPPPPLDKGRVQCLAFTSLARSPLRLPCNQLQTRRWVAAWVDGFCFGWVAGWLGASSKCQPMTDKDS